jgi:hypothetical protein
VVDAAGSPLKAGDDAVLVCEVLRVVEAVEDTEPGVVVRILNSDQTLFVSARKIPLRGLVASEELMKLQVSEPKITIHEEL